MKHLLLGAAIIIAVVASSCTKSDSKTQKRSQDQTESIFKKFIDSLDPMTQPQRIAAIKTFAANNPKLMLNVTIDQLQGGPRRYVTIAASHADSVYYSELIQFYTYGGYNPTATLYDDLGYYTDSYINSYGESVEINGPTRIMSWVIVQNPDNLWKVTSYEQFVSSNCEADPTNCVFLGVKHKYSTLTGPGSNKVIWFESSSNCLLSNQGAAATTHVEGTVYFTDNGLTSNAGVTASHNWTYDDVF
jgi:hypothetical protein